MAARTAPIAGVEPGVEPRPGKPFPDVLTAAQAGEGWALEQIWNELAAAVHGYLRSQGSAEPDDLTSTVFVGVFQGIGGFSGDEQQFRSWVFTIAHHRLVDERRRRQRRSRFAVIEVELDDTSPGHPVSSTDVDEHVARRLGEERVRALCEALVPDQRDVLLLRLVGGLTVDEIAGVLGKSPGAVKALQRRGLAAVERATIRKGVPL